MYIFVLIILIIILIIVLFLLCMNKEPFEDKLVFITFGGGGQNYYDAATRITNEVKSLKAFNQYITYTDSDLKKDEFWKTHSQFIENNKRGYGYWLWKPYIILKTLNSMNNDEILLYLDGGCEIKSNESNESNELNKLIERCKQNDILYTLTGKEEKKYTKMDLFIELNMNKDEIKDIAQCQAGVIFLKKNEKIMKMVNEWYQLSCNYHLIDDSDSLSENDKEFIEHRHDQSIFSLLIKKYNYNKYDNIMNDDLIQISRKRNG